MCAVHETWDRDRGQLSVIKSGDFHPTKHLNHWWRFHFHNRRGNWNRRVWAGGWGTSGKERTDRVNRWCVSAGTSSGACEFQLQRQRKGEKMRGCTSVCVCACILSPFSQSQAPFRQMSSDRSWWEKLAQRRKGVNDRVGGEGRGRGVRTGERERESVCVLWWWK